MSSRRSLWLLVPRQLRELPADLVAILALILATNAVVFVPVLNDSPLRVVVGLVFVLFGPGYAFIAALFPEAGRSPTEIEPSRAEDGDRDWQSDRDDDAAQHDRESEGLLDDPSIRDRGIDGIERVALSFGLSIAIVPLIGLVLNFTPFGIRLVPILVSLSAFTAVATAIAAVRRWELPEDERFRVPYRQWIATGRKEVFEPDSNVDAALNVLLALSVLLALGSVTYAIAVPPQGEQFTEFYLLTEDDDGELVADGYPEALIAGQPEPIHVGIGNNEYETREYTTIVQLQRVETVGNETNVLERSRVDRWSTTLEHNETEIERRNLTATDELTGEQLRLTFLLYAEEPPAQPTRENAYRDLHLWVNVSTAETM